MATLFFDHDAADKRVVRALRRLGHEVTSAAEQQLDEASDGELLHYAGRARLVLVTHNERDFVALHDAEREPHVGILIIPHVRPDSIHTLVAAIDEVTRGDRPLAGECRRLQPVGWERRTERRAWEPG